MKFKFKIKRISNAHIVTMDNDDGNPYSVKEFCVIDGNDLVEDLITKLKPTIREKIGEIHLSVNSETEREISITNNFLR